MVAKTRGEVAYMFSPALPAPGTDLLAAEHPLYRFAELFIFAVNTTHPTAGATHAVL